MYNYQILRKEVVKSRQGIDEVFVDLQIYHSTLGVINAPKWFTGSQASMIIADENALLPLIESMIHGIIAQKQIEMTSEAQLSDD